MHNHALIMSGQDCSMGDGNPGGERRELAGSNEKAEGPLAPRKVLVVGGSLDHLGGVEAFCDRAAEALRAAGGAWQSERIAASTAYLTMRRLPALFHGLAQLAAHRRVNRPDIVWLQYVNLPDLLYLITARLLGMRVMVTPHLGSNWRSQSNRFLRRISERTLRLAERLALISWTQEVEIGLPRLLPRSLIRNFLPLEVLTAPLADTAAMPPELQLIHSSRLSEGKGTFMVVEVCGRLRDMGVPFTARITGIGDAATMDRLHAMIAERDLGDQVLVLGRVPEAELLDHLRQSDVLVHLSRIDSYPLIVLEAMACSATPIALELPGVRDMVETYCGKVVSAADTVEETVEWLRACDLVALRASRTETAARVRADYDWSRCASALAAALNACLKRDRHTTTQPALVDEGSSRSA